MQSVIQDLEDKNERVNNDIKNYERRIDNLLSDLGSYMKRVVGLEQTKEEVEEAIKIIKKKK